MLWLKTLFLIVAIGCFAVACAGSDDDDDDSDDDADNDDDDDNTPENLTWEDPPSDRGWTWGDAELYCENLEIDGYDDWRLPTISELRSLIRGCGATEPGGACDVTDDCIDYDDCRSDSCDGCDYLEGPGSDGAYWPKGMSGEIGGYWSSSPVINPSGFMWFVSFGGASINYAGYAGGALVRCVR